MIKDKKEPIITISLSEADLKTIKYCFNNYLEYCSPHFCFKDVLELKTLFTRDEKKLEKLKEHMESLQ